MRLVSALLLATTHVSLRSARLALPVMKNVTRVDREFDDPLPPEATGLDAVIVVLFYHDTYWLKTDRAAMNRAVLKALKPGGVYGIIDHSGRPATPINQLHKWRMQSAS